ncbi:MAG: hypothetical protein EHM39_06375 [Chloroflexi bacterium]|nr:MAG: hypothetical protein EHM39_06375 [Chloroflexota bacterium]
MASYREAPKVKKKPRGLPILGLMLALALAAVAYGVSFPLVGFIEERYPDVRNQFDDLRDDFARRPWYQDSQDIHGNNIVEIIVAVVLWFVMMGLAMFAVSAALVGTDADREALKALPPSPADKKAMVKQMKKDLKDAKRRAREMNRHKK